VIPHARRERGHLRLVTDEGALQLREDEMGRPRLVAVGEPRRPSRWPWVVVAILVPVAAFLLGAGGVVCSRAAEPRTVEVGE